MPEFLIKNVSDTAIWVAHYRALETARPDSLFKDPFAKKLAGDRGKKIAESLKAMSPYVYFSVSIRTVVIDRWLKKLAADGVDTIVNLGCGLDARPYRLDLGKSVRWVEVDYPDMIDYKTEVLKNDRPLLPLERVSLDLAKRGERKRLFARLAGESKNIAVITEGVLPYLTSEQVAELADDLRAFPSFRYWIAEYMAKEVYRYIRDRRYANGLKHAPFQFFPDDWFGFFKERGWKQGETRYLPEVALEAGRKQPAPWYARLTLPFLPKNIRMKIRRMSAYVLFTPDSF